MKRRPSLSRTVGYALSVFLFAGVGACLAARDSDIDRWLLGVGGSLYLIVGVWQTAGATLMIWRSWQLRLFGEDVWGVLADKQGRNDADLNTFWTAQVTGPGFAYTIDTETQDPGRVGERVLVRRHVPSGQVELRPARAPVSALIRDMVGPFALVLAAGSLAGVGFGVLWALDLLG